MGCRCPDWPCRTGASRSGRAECQPRPSGPSSTPHKPSCTAGPATGRTGCTTVGRQAQSAYTAGSSRARASCSGRARHWPRSRRPGSSPTPASRVEDKGHAVTDEERAVAELELFWLFAAVAAESVDPGHLPLLEARVLRRWVQDGAGVCWDLDRAVVAGRNHRCERRLRLGMLDLCPGHAATSFSRRCARGAEEGELEAQRVELRRRDHAARSCTRTASGRPSGCGWSGPSRSFRDRSQERHLQLTL